MIIYHAHYFILFILLFYSTRIFLILVESTSLLQYYYDSINLSLFSSIQSHIVVHIALLFHYCHYHYMYFAIASHKIYNNSIRICFEHHDGRSTETVKTSFCCICKSVHVCCCCNGIFLF